VSVFGQSANVFNESARVFPNARVFFPKLPMYYRKVPAYLEKVPMFSEKVPVFSEMFSCFCEKCECILKKRPCVPLLHVIIQQLTPKPRIFKKRPRQPPNPSHLPLHSSILMNFRGNSLLSTPFPSYFPHSRPFDAVRRRARPHAERGNEGDRRLFFVCFQRLLN